jgi:hypothetical protein
MKTSIIPSGLLTLTALLMACGNSNGPGSGLALSFATRSASVSAAAPVFAAPATAGSTAADNLVITSAQLVLRKIELERSDASTCAQTANTESCHELEVGPVLVSLPLTAGATTQVSVDLPAGTYKEVQFQIHKVSDSDPAEAAFRTANPAFVGKSIRVLGTFNGTAFTYESDLDVEQELSLQPNLVVTDQTATTSLTISVVLGDWFKTASGGLVDPSTASKGGVNEGLVKENIKRSMKAFEDENHDGNEDH